MKKTYPNGRFQTRMTQGTQGPSAGRWLAILPVALLVAWLITPVMLLGDDPPAQATTTQPANSNVEEKKAPTTQQARTAEAAAARKPQTVDHYALNDFMELYRKGDADSRKKMTGYLDGSKLERTADGQIPEGRLTELAVRLATFLDTEKLVTPELLIQIQSGEPKTEHCLYWGAPLLPDKPEPTSQPTTTTTTSAPSDSATPEAPKAEPEKVCLIRFLKQEDGLWRFGPDTVLRIPLLSVKATPTPGKIDETKTATGTTKPPTTPESTGEKTAVSDKPPVPKAFRTPQATMRSFLQSFDPKVTERVSSADCLNLSKRALGPQDAWARTLARGLKFVLDRWIYVQVGSIPDDPNEPSPYLYKAITNDGGEEIGVISLEKLPDGRWLFSDATLNDLPEMIRAVADAPPKVPNAPEFSLFEMPELYLLIWVPEWARQKWWFLELWQWMGLAVVLFVGLLADRVARGVLRAFSRFTFNRLSKHTQAEVRQISFRPIGIVLMGYLWLVLFPLLWLPAWMGILLTTMSWFVIILAAIWSTYRLIDIITSIMSVVMDRRASTFDDLLVPFIRKFLKIIVTIFGIVYFFGRIYPDDVDALLGGLGLGGLAFALAAQDTIKNVFGSITVMLDRPFEIGDWIKLEGVEGMVESVGFRSTRIRTFAHSLISVPNGKLIEAIVDNYGRRQYRRLTTRLNLTYSMTPDKIEAFCEGIRELIRRHPYTRKDQYHVYFNEFGSHSLDVMLYCFFEVPDWATELRERHRLLTDILRLASRLGIDFAFPTQTLHIHDADMAPKPPLDLPKRAENLAADIIGRSEAAVLTKTSVPPPDSLAPVEIKQEPQPVDEDYIKQRLGIVDEPEEKKKA